MTIEADVARLQAQYERRKKEREEKTRGKDLVPVREHMQDAYQSLELRATAHEGVTGCRTGFVDLDLATGGLQKGHMAIVAGRPAMGKTSWALNVAVNSAKAGHHVGIYSLEMSTRELLTRALCTEARADAQVLRAGKLDQFGWRNIGEACVALSGLPLYICDRGDISVEDIEASVERRKAAGGLDLIIIDYLQLMGGKRKAGDNREREIAETTRRLKISAGQLGVAVVVVSQLNRGLEARKDKQPMLSDLRESGAIEQDADLVLFIHRPGYYDHGAEIRAAELIISKNRHGPTKTCAMNWVPEWTLFTSATERYE